MSLPEKVILAGPVQLPSLSSNDNAIAGVADPQYLISLKQIPFLQLTRLFDQLTDFTGYANDMFFGLANESIRVSDRINALTSKIDELARRMPEFKTTIEKMENLKPIGRERSSWKTQYLITSNLFTKATQSVEIREALEKCPPIPPVDILDVFRTDGKSSMNLFSYPGFFVEEWKTLLSGNKKSRKQTKGSAADLLVDEDRSARTDADFEQSEFMASNPNKVQRERKHVQESGIREASFRPSSPTSFHFRSSSKKLAAPIPPAPPVPPPPPPPPMMTPTASMISPKNPSLLSKAKSPDTESAVDRGFLSDIKGNQFKLKKTEVQTKEERKKQGEPEGVAAILMRRAALQDDSNSDNENEDEWN